MPPARIASASSSLSRRSPWLSLGSKPGSATVRASATTLPWRFEPVDDARDQGVVGQVGQLRREVGARDRRLPRAGRVQPAQGAKHPVLQVGRELDQHADRPPRTDRELDQGARRRERRQAGFDLVDGQPGQRGEASLGPGREAEEGQGRAQALDRVGRSQAAEALDRRAIAAAIAARAGLERPGRRRASPAGSRSRSTNGWPWTATTGSARKSWASRGAPGSDLVRLQQRQHGRDLGRPQVELVPAPVPQRPDRPRPIRRPRPRGSASAPGSPARPAPGRGGSRRDGRRPG